MGRLAGWDEAKHDAGRQREMNHDIGGGGGGGVGRKNWVRCDREATTWVKFLVLLRLDVFSVPEE